MHDFGKENFNFIYNYSDALMASQMNHLEGLINRLQANQKTEIAYVLMDLLDYD